MSCTQGGSILCYQSKGEGYTQCQVDINGCPSNTNQQYDTSSGTSVPTSVCLPKSYTSESQFIYDAFNVCADQITSYAFVSSPKYGVTIMVQLNLFTPIGSSFTVTYGNTTQAESIPSNISSQPLITDSCGSYVVWDYQLAFSGAQPSVSVSSGVVISEIYI